MKIYAMSNINTMLNNLSNCNDTCHRRSIANKDLRFHVFKSSIESHFIIASKICWYDFLSYFGLFVEIYPHVDQSY